MMKKLLFAILLLPIVGYSQISNATLTTKNDSLIRNLTVNQKRSADFNKLMIDSKANVTSNLLDLTNKPVALTNLGGTTVGVNLFKLTNPSAVTFLRINADNTITTRSASQLVGDLGAGTVSTLSVVTTNGFSGIVANASTTPAITMQTTVSGVIKGVGNGLVAAASDVDFVTPTGNGTLSNKTLTAPKFANGGFIADVNGTEALIINATAGAVNELTITNAATGGNPRISASGDDTNVGLDFLAKGTGAIRLSSNATQAAELRFYEITGSGTNFTAFKAGAQAANVTYTWPTADGTSGQSLQTNGSGVLSWGSSGGLSFPLTDSQLTINNPAATFAYTIKAQALGANRNLYLPLISGTDTLVEKSYVDALTLATPIDPFYGGTGVSNNSAATLTRSGNHALTITTTGITGITLPTSGTLVNTAVTSLSSLTTVGTLTSGATGAGFTIALTTSTVTGTLGAARGGTGVSNNAASTLTISGSFGTTLTVSGTTTLTLPTSGTLATRAGTETLTNKTIDGSSNTISNVSLTAGVTGVLPLANGGTAANLSDPGGHRGLSWDDTDNAIGFTTYGTGLFYDHATHTLSATAGSAWAVTGSTTITGNTTQTGAFSNTFSLNGIVLTQNAMSSAWIPALKITPGAHTSLTTTTEFPEFTVESSTQTHATGTIPDQRDVWIKSQTHAFAAGSAITRGYGLYVEKPTAGTNASITNNYALGTVGDIKLIGDVLWMGGTTAGASRYINLEGSATDVGLWITAKGAGVIQATASGTTKNLMFEEFVTDATTSRTLTAADCGKWIRFTNSSAIAVTAADGLPTGCACGLIKETGSGVITISASTTLESLNSLNTLNTALAEAVLKHKGSNVWKLSGQLGAQ